jgi:hypothetical protein
VAGVPHPRACVAALTATVAVLLGAAGPALANTFTVDVATDGGGAGTLRSRIADAVSNPGPDSIVFDPSLAGQTIALSVPSGALTINDPGGTLTINPAGGGEVSGITVDGQSATKLLHVVAGDVTVHGLTLTHGHSVVGTSGADGSGNGGNAGGSPILNEAGATLTFDECTITSNAGGAGGHGGDGTDPGVAGGGGGGGGAAIQNAGHMTIRASTMVGNEGGDGGAGGFSPVSAGAGGGAGAGAITTSSPGDLTITDSTLSGNRGGAGGSGSQANGEGTGGGGGAAGAAITVASGGSATIENTTVDGSIPQQSGSGGIATADSVRDIGGGGGGGPGGGGGGGGTDTGQTTAGGVGTTGNGGAGADLVHGADAGAGAGSGGGGGGAGGRLAGQGGPGDGGGGGVGADGGGPTPGGGGAGSGGEGFGGGGGGGGFGGGSGGTTSQSGTFPPSPYGGTGGNGLGDPGGDGSFGGGGGGGGSGPSSHAGAGSIGAGALVAGGSVTMVSSILADSTQQAGPAAVSDCRGTIASGSSNLVEDPAGCNRASGDSLAGDPLLDPAGPANHGGPTATIMLRSDSPALDAGSNPGSLASDQRGVARSIGASPDIGAVEVKLLSASDDSPTVVEDSSGAVDVLGNDVDPDGAGKRVSSVTQPSHGAATITGGGTGISYTPAANYCGQDSFTYTLNHASPATATVSLTVQCVDDPPTAAADSKTLEEDAGATTIDVLANDSDVDGGPKSVASVTQPSHGSAAITGGGTGVSYTPAANYCGADSFTYTLNGGSTATVTLTVNCVEDDPHAVDDSVSVTEDSPATVDVLGNDTDPDGGTKAVTSVTQPSHGAAAITGGGTGVSYTPAANYCGADSLTYTVNGGSTATVSVSVACVDDTPVAVGDSLKLREDSAVVTVDVLANDTDVDGGPKTVDSLAGPRHGTASVTGGGAGVSYKPAVDFCGADSFTYTLNGGSTATVAVNVSCVSDPRIAISHASTALSKSRIRVLLDCRGPKGNFCRGTFSVAATNRTTRSKRVAAAAAGVAFKIRTGVTKAVEVTPPAKLVRFIRAHHGHGVGLARALFTDADGGPLTTYQRLITVIAR